MSKNKLVMYFFVGSESFFFLGLIISYLYLNRAGGPIQFTQQYLNITRALIFSVILWISSLTIYISVRKLKKGKRKSAIVWLLITIALGSAFIVEQVMEYFDLLQLNINIGLNVFGSAFYAVTGFDGLHVFVGLIILLLFVRFLSVNYFKSKETDAYSAISIYWYFVSVLWFVIYGVVYLKIP